MDDPTHWDISIHQPAGGAELRIGKALLNADGISAVWCRRLPAYLPHYSDETNYKYQERRALVLGLLTYYDGLIVNHPERTDRAMNKILQLKLAQEYGFEIPRTAHTNAAVGRLQLADGPYGIVKPIQGRYYTLLDHPGQFRSLTTRLPPLAELSEDALEVPVTMQSQVEISRELRVFVIGEQVLSVAVTSDQDYLDWRSVADTNLSVSIAELPTADTSKLKTLVDGFGLQYAAIDLLETPDTSLVFLEINPSGQWDWYELKSGLKITEALAEGLMPGV